MVLCKGVAQDNRLSSEWTTQMGLRLIVGCDKERRGGRDQAFQAELCKPKGPKKTLSDSSSHSIRESMSITDTGIE